MTVATLDELVRESERQRLGPLWLGEIHQAAVEVSRRYDPAVYAVAERAWSTAEIDELVQDVTTEELLSQGQLDYILDVSRSIEDVRRLLRHHVRRGLARRRRRTVVDRLLERIAVLLNGSDYEELPGAAPKQHRPVGSGLTADQPNEEQIGRAAAAVRMLPVSAAAGERAPAVFTTEVLSEVVAQSFDRAGCSLSRDDFGRILRSALTSWLPVVLELDEEAASAQAADPADLPGDLERTADAVLSQLSKEDRLVLRCKMSGASDSELAGLLDVSRPTAAKRKNRAFASLRSAWEEHASDLPSAWTPGLAQLIYLRLSRSDGGGR